MAGITGCLTPSGIPFNTLEGRLIIGLEALALQGLPIDMLQLSRLTQSELQDLAGNAMSTPVVGALEIAALITFFKVFKHGTMNMDIDEPEIKVKFDGEENLVERKSNPGDFEAPISRQNAVAAAKSALRLCYCEGRHSLTTNTLLRCGSCHHTVCNKCAGMPPHSYSQIPQNLVDDRIEPVAFEKMIKKSLPMKVGLSHNLLPEHRRLLREAIDPNARRLYIDAISKALTSKLCFRTIKRAEIVTIEYDCDLARMELVFDSDQAEWRLYAKPNPDLPVNSPIRKLLRHPFARMRPGEDIVQGSWQLWLPKKQSFKTVIRGQGTLVRSFENIQGLDVHASTLTWSSYSVEMREADISNLDHDIRGDYELLQNCGMASGSLHIQAKTKASKKRNFFYLDPDKLGDPKDDFFVFSFDKRRLGFGESRQITARLDASWRPPKYESVELAGVVKYRFDGCKDPVDKSKLPTEYHVDVHVDGRWIEFSGMSFNLSGTADADTESIKYHHMPVKISIPLSMSSCRSTSAVLTCKMTLPKGMLAHWPRKKWILVDKANERDFYNDFAWALEHGRVLPGHYQADGWRDTTTMPLTCCCRECAPKPPGLLWKLDKMKLIPFEKPEEAVHFEHALKNRPSPLISQVHIDDKDFVQMKIGINPHSLAHRAFARLTGDEPASNVTTSWRLVTDDSIEANARLPGF
jgi:hypothetical protein